MSISETKEEINIPLSEYKFLRLRFLETNGKHVSKSKCLCGSKYLKLLCEKCYSINTNKCKLCGSITCKKCDVIITDSKNNKHNLCTACWVSIDDIVRHSGGS